jgi:iron-sulfur cluster assembly protein
MLQISERAASVICHLTEPGYAPDSAGLRVAAGDPPPLSIAPDAHAGDIVLEANGARVFVDPEAAPRMVDTQLDVQVDANGAVDFAFVPASERPRSAVDVLDHHLHC